MDRRAVGEHFGDNLRRCRQRARLPQEGVAQASAMHRSYLTLIERGLRLTRVDTTVRLAAAVDATPCDLLRGLRWRPGYYVEGEFYLEDRAGFSRSSEALR